MKTGTNLASARRKSGFIASRPRLGSHSGSEDSTRAAPSLSPRIVLISTAAAVQIGRVAFSPGRTSIDSRITPIRMPTSEPGAPDTVVWLAYGVARTEERGTVV